MRSRRISHAIKTVLVLLVSVVAHVAATPVMALQEPEMGSIDAHVDIAGLGGAAPGPGMPPPRPWVIGPAVGATVQALDPQAPDAPVAEANTDTNGQVTFQLPPGHYWVVVPWSDAVAGAGSAPPLAVTTPTDQVVLAWAEAWLPDTRPLSVSLTIEVALP